MFRWIRSARIAKGRFPQAIGWAKEVSGYAQKKFATPPIHVYVAAFGEAGTVRWEVEYKDLATFEKVQTAMMNDGEYWQYIAKANEAELFIDGTAKDELLREV